MIRIMLPNRRKRPMAASNRAFLNYDPARPGVLVADTSPGVIAFEVPPSVPLKTLVAMRHDATLITLLNGLSDHLGMTGIGATAAYIQQLTGEVQP